MRKPGVNAPLSRHCVYCPIRLVKWTSAVNFIDIKHTNFFVRKFVQSQNVTRKKTFIRKTHAFNVDEIDAWSPPTF